MVRDVAILDIIAFFVEPAFLITCTQYLSTTGIYVNIAGGMCRERDEMTNKDILDGELLLFLLEQAVDEGCY